MIDLHIHSAYSDGTFNVNEIVELADIKGMKIISLTDHDSIDGLEEAGKMCVEKNIMFINGIEIST